MGIGVISLVTSQKREPSGSPFTPASAHNGTSIDAAGKVVLGNDVGDPLAPAQLLNDREIITEDALLNLFAIILNSIQTGITTRLTGQTIEMDGNGNTSPTITMQTSGNAGTNLVELQNLGGQNNILLNNTTNGDNNISLITTGAGGNSTILTRANNGGLSQIRVHSIPDSIEIFARGNGVIVFQINNIVPVIQVQTSTFNTQIGNQVGFNGAVVQLSGTVTKRLLPESHAAGSYTLDRDLDSSKVFRNTGALTLNLPNMVGSNFRLGFYFDVHVTDPSGITLNAGAATTIQFGDLATSVAGTISATNVGCYMRIVIVDSTTYNAAFFIGSWSLT